MTLPLQTREEQGTLVVSPKGKLILDHGTALHDEVKRAVGQGVRRLALDLSAVPYVDSHGLAQLVACHATVCREGGQIRFAGLPRKVLELLEMTHVPGVLGFDPDLPASLKKLSGS